MLRQEFEREQSLRRRQQGQQGSISTEGEGSRPAGSQPGAGGGAANNVQPGAAEAGAPLADDSLGGAVGGHAAAAESRGEAGTGKGDAGAADDAGPAGVAGAAAEAAAADNAGRQGSGGGPVSTAAMPDAAARAVDGGGTAVGSSAAAAAGLGADLSSIPHASSITAGHPGVARASAATRSGPLVPRMQAFEEGTKRKLAVLQSFDSDEDSDAGAGAGEPIAEAAFC